MFSILTIVSYGTPSHWYHCKSASEDTSRFLINCPLYQLPRGEVFISVMLITTPLNLFHERSNPYIYLYGHNSLSYEDNRILFYGQLNTLRILIDLN